MRTFTTNSVRVGRAQRVVKDGEAWWVAPAVSLPGGGVLNGSKGALHYPPEHVERSTPYWNNCPITLRHPTDNAGNPVTAREAPNQHLGIVRDSRYDGKLRHKMWFNERQTRNRAPIILHSLQHGHPIELSTGLFTENVELPGINHEGKPYTHEARHYRPDHIAVLPDELGACSVNDGCGVGVINANPNHDDKGRFSEGPSGSVQMSVQGIPAVKPKKTALSKLSITQADSKLNEKGYGLTGKGHFDLSSMTAHYEVSHPDGTKKMMPLHEIAKLVGNANPEGHNQYTGGTTRLEEVGAKSDLTNVKFANAKSVRARELSAVASKSGDSKDHERAANAHVKAYTAHHEGSLAAADPKVREYHEKMAKEHNSASNHHDSMTTNCSCRPTNNGDPQSRTTSTRAALQCPT